MSEFSERLTNLRESRGWSKTYTANKLKLNLPTYANYEYGRREPDLETVERIADLFDVTADYLMGRKSSPNVVIKKPTDLNEALDSVMSFDGKPLNEHDKKVMINIWKAYYKSKDEE